MTHEERMADVRQNPEKHQHPDLNALIACCMVGGAVDITVMDAHGVRDANGFEHDVKSGPCACGGWH